MSGQIDVYVESGAKRVFAGAVEWPGWSRSGKTEELALEALMAYAPRYAKVMKGFRPAFRIPTELRVVERVWGDATTDFGAPSQTAKADRRPVDAKELAWLRKVLQAAWAAFDEAAERARGKKLKTGPRGGGRSLAKIVGHVVGAEGGYVRTIRGKAPEVDERQAPAMANVARGVALEALTRAVTEGLPDRGPRGGKIWTPRYFVRRAAWHVLDHAWEIQDRS
ncbi:MAG TPA: DinB family protein [Actinomycetota bacterium]|nr:DinB family protein [Actinomycetota bacterium]